MLTDEGVFTLFPLASTAGSGTRASQLNEFLPQFACSSVCQIHCIFDAIACGALRT